MKGCGHHISGRARLGMSGDRSAVARMFRYAAVLFAVGLIPVMFHRCDRSDAKQQRGFLAGLGIQVSKL